jgi:alginate O-acetyltransferase complex protein AlgI
MTIASLPFLAFAVLVAVVHGVLPGLRARQTLLLVANFFFVSTFVPTLLAALPLAGFVAAGYGGYLIVRRNRSRPPFVAVLALVVALFFWLKHYSFVPAATFLPFAYSTIGLSYIFFRTLHVIIDTHDGAFDGLDLAGEDRGGGPDDRIGPVAYLNYTLNFTSLVSGPIQLFGDYAADQLRANRPRFTWVNLGVAIERIAIGFFKVTVLATILFAVHQNNLASLPTSASLQERVSTVLLIGVGYTLYLYCNFSGYTDIVIGAARLYHLNQPENFNHPFSATSFIDLWSRWHITLSSWLKTYVYNPLVLALMTRFDSPRLAAVHGVIAYFVTFFLIGLWHGQTSVFAVFGVLQGLGVSINKIHQLAMIAWLGRRGYRAVAERVLYRLIARGLTFSYFTLSLFCFWGNWTQIGMIIHLLGVAGIVIVVAAMIVGTGLVLTALEGVRVRFNGVAAIRSRYVRTVWTTMLAVTAVTVLMLMASPAPDIVYKAF